MSYRIEAESIIKEFEFSKTSLEAFIDNLTFRIISKSKNKIEFDLINCHPSVANALRRILIAKVPSVAIEDVVIYENNSVFPDEYLAHRIGLIPIRTVLNSFYNEDESSVLDFKLNKKNNTNEVLLVTSSDIEFVPSSNRGAPDLMKRDVIICKLAPGNEISMSFKAKLGLGSDHAKFSPVSLCSYKIMPNIVLLKEFTGEEALLLQSCFSPGVIIIEDNKAKVSNPRLDSISREFLRHESLKDSVKLLRETGWYCFTVESIIEDPLDILKKGIEVFIGCCKDLKYELERLSEDYC